MKDLSPNARALLDTGRAAYRPRPGDRERIEAALRAHLGAQALQQRNTAKLRRWRVVTGTGFAVFLAAGAAIWGSRGEPQKTPPTPQLAEQPSPKLELLAEEPATAELPTLAPAAAAPPKARPDPLKQELALLTRATRNSNVGNWAKALAALTEHERRFPHGALAEERMAQKAQVLCALGRVSEGRAQQALLPAKSPTAARAEQACDAATARTRDSK